MAINPIGPAAVNPPANIAPLSQPNAVRPAAKPDTYAPQAPQTPEIGRNLATTGPKEKAGIIELKDRAAQAGMAAELGAVSVESVVPPQMMSTGADGKLESSGTLTDNMKEMQEAIGPSKAGEASSLFDTQTPSEAAENDKTPSFALETPETDAGQVSRSAANGLVNGFNAMSKAAGEIGSDRLQARLDAIYESAAGGLREAGIARGGDGSLRVDFPGQDSGGAMNEFAARLKSLADEVSQNPAGFLKNKDEGVLYGANGGVQTQLSAQMSGIGKLFDSFM